MGWIVQYVLPQVGGDLFQLRYSLCLETHDAVLDAPSCTKIPAMYRSFELILAAAEHVNTGNTAFTCGLFIFRQTRVAIPSPKAGDEQSKTASLRIRQKAGLQTTH